MEKYFIVTEDTKNELLSLDKKLTNEFPRVILKINGRTDGWSLVISGTDDDVTRYIDRLRDNDIILDS